VIEMRQLSNWSSSGSITVDVPLEAEAPGDNNSGSAISAFDWVTSHWQLIAIAVLAIISIPEAAAERKK